MSDEHISTSNIDVTDEQGTARLSLTGADDLDGTRIGKAAGVLIRDRTGRERGGFTTIAEPDGNRVGMSLDHPGGDAIGMTVNDRGEAAWVINDAPGEDRTPRSLRLKGAVASDGMPTIDVFDAQERPRLRLTLTDGGAGSIEFLNASGEIVYRLAPEEAMPSQ